MEQRVRGELEGDWTVTGGGAARVPTSTDDVCITLPGTYTVTLGGSVSVNEIAIGNTPANAGDDETLAIQSNDSVLAFGGQHFEHHRGGRNPRRGRRHHGTRARRSRWPADRHRHQRRLSSTQLDATASVPGTFTYTPPATTVLGVGANQTLSVLFTPTDGTDYTTATDTPTITVNAATSGTTTVLHSSINPSTVSQTPSLTRHRHRGFDHTHGDGHLL